MPRNGNLLNPENEVLLESTNMTTIKVRQYNETFITSATSSASKEQN